ncbi:ROK family protein [Paenibacillus sp.]|uniref:ROK family protein n=1 Tax=Paenibacillus sp. TaxID=58172 RepID=UPI002D3E5FA0|nr:ROK family protein [Paenibacillus sp.]HZG87081.1 ROK family protein [Paenibacillus sp.]
MNGKLLGGVDIGGTKCAVVLGEASGGGVRVVGKRTYPTPASPADAVASFLHQMDGLMAEHGVARLDAIGVSCGSPLDSRRGLILSPPNLPHWDRIDVAGPLRARFGAPVGLQNDANACALAEWRWGAGRGSRNMAFLTFGTGMGAGLILDGKLYVGTNDMAGEVGHVRLAEDGPVGYGKAGSFEGFCSGGGIAALAKSLAAERLAAGDPPAFCPTPDRLEAVTAKLVGEAAQAGDPLALDIFRLVGKQLGRGLAVLVDILNPDTIVIGSIYGRQRELLEPVALATLAEEALPISAASCRVVPAALGEAVGDVAALSVAMNELQPR